MEDFPPPWNGDERSKRKRHLKDDHRIEFSDEGWGMAFDADMYDGNEGEIEDWAAGMVHEEGRGDGNWRDRKEQDFEGDYDDYYPSSRYEYAGSYNINNSSQQKKPHDPKKPSPAIERAAQFLDRVEGRPRKHGGRSNDRPRNSLRTDRRDRHQMSQRGDYVDMPSGLHAPRNAPQYAERDQGCLATLFGFELDTNNLPMMAAMALTFVCILVFFAMMVFVALSGVL
jgi:hypothetical protein